MIDDKYIKDGDYILTSEQLTILTLASMNLSCKGNLYYFNNLDNGHA
ncbi:hypothetical protein B0I67_005728 [Clostridium beijerinckii]|nr:hypothetical protein [Clostridium beijerinckii]